MSEDTPTPVPESPAPAGERFPIEYSLKDGRLHRWGHPLSCPFQPAFIGPSRIQGQQPKINRIICSKDCALFHFELLPATKFGVPSTDPNAEMVVPAVTLSCGSGRTMVVEIPSDKDAAAGTPN